ncbi:MAG: peptidoglycan DD-metalloendopeptidase family protein [Armatimonadetes bacterium]|nr:peptidoglycan DD-metalloendopeptidase family protein [Armatimonadota bacterium]
MREIHYYRNRLRQTKRLQSRAFADMEDARDRLSATRDSIESLESRIRLVRLQVKLIRQRLVRIQAKLDRHKAALGQRLASIYRNGSVSYVSVVCNSGDYWDFLSRSHYAKRVVDSDVDLIQQIKEEREDIAYGKRLLDRKKTQISRLFFRLQAVKMAQRQEASEKLEEFKDISQQRAYFEQHLAQLEQNSREIEEMIRRLAVTPQGRARMARPWRGGFIRPVNGRITSGFGYRQHPILKRYKLHTGTDLAAPSGTPIRAAAGGVVIHAGWWGAYGNCVIIDHGGGVSTLYGHCSSLSVSNGQSVKQGQTIGRVGSTGFSTGPHLHFEVRQNGVPRNPL